MTTSKVTIYIVFPHPLLKVVNVLLVLTTIDTSEEDFGNVRRRHAFTVVGSSVDHVADTVASSKHIVELFQCLGGWASSIPETMV